MKSCNTQKRTSFHWSLFTSFVRNSKRLLFYSIFVAVASGAVKSFLLLKISKRFFVVVVCTLFFHTQKKEKRIKFVSNVRWETESVCLNSHLYNVAIALKMENFIYFFAMRFQSMNVFTE